MAVVASDGKLVSIQEAPRGIALGSLDLYAGLTMSYGEIYRTQPAVRTVVKFFARNIAQLGIKHYRRLDDNDREHVSGSEFERTIRRPNPDPASKVTRYRLISSFVHDRCVYGNAYLAKVKVSTSSRIALVRLPPKMVTPIGKNWITPEGYEIRGNRGKMELAADQVVHSMYYNPDTDTRGISPLESLRRTLAEDMAAGAYREQFWRNGARVSGIVKRPPAKETGIREWSDAARERFLAEFSALYSGDGPDAGGVGLLEDGMDFVPGAFSAVDAQYIEARKLTRSEVAAAFFVPDPMVGILDHATFSNITEQHKMTYQDTLGPELVGLEEDFELQLLPEFGDVQEEDYLEFNIAEKLKGSFEEQADAMARLTGAPVMARNEGRARLNLSRIEDDRFDVPVTPLNVLQGGQTIPGEAVPGDSAPKRRDRKAREALAGQHVLKHLEVLTAFFNRQERAIASKLGASDTLEEAWDDERWNAELGVDLLALARQTAQEFGDDIAAVFESSYDVDDLGLPYLEERSRIAAENVNATTKDHLQAALDDPEQDDAVGATFDEARDVRADTIATGQVAAAGNFGATEAATEAGAGEKTWVVTSGNPRASHAAMDGETVAIGEDFSNGAKWPGDPTLPVEEVAGCTCGVDFS